MRERLKRLDVTLRVDARVNTPIVANRPTNTLWLPPGHPILKAYDLVCQGVLYLYDPRLTPSFIEPPVTACPDAPTLRLVAPRNN